MVYRSFSSDSGALGWRNPEKGSDSISPGASFSSEHIYCCSTLARTDTTNSCCFSKTCSVSTHAPLTASGSTSLSSVFNSPWPACSSSCSCTTNSSNSYGCRGNSNITNSSNTNSTSVICNSERESRGSVAVKKLALFCLGVSCGLPWNCVVVEMTEFQFFYLPTFPWISVATAVRTCSLVLGHLLLCLLPLQHSAAWLSVGGSVISALCCLLLSLVAPSAVRTSWRDFTGPLGAPSSPSSESLAFALSCVLLGVSSFCCCGMRSGLYTQQALTHKSFVSSWVLGMAMGGPLTALAALGLHWGMRGAPPQCKTQILMGASFLWLLFSAALSAYALAKTKLGGKQMPIQQLQQHHQQQPMITMPLGGFPAPEGGAAAAAAAQQRERLKLQLPNEARNSGANNSSVSWLTDETTELLQDFEWHDRSSSSNSSSSSGKCLECVAEGLNVRLGVLQQFEVYTFLFRRYRQCLLCTFFLSLSTFVLYPVKMQCMLPCSSADPAMFQLLLIVIYHLGVVAGRCCYCYCRCCSSSSSQRLIPAVLLLRFALLPLLFWLEAAPAKLLPVLRAATGATAAAGRVGLRGTEEAAAADLSLQHEHVASAPLLAAGEHKQHEQLLLLLVDVCRCLWLFVFAAVHGCLSLTGTIYITHTPETYVHKAAATRLLCLFESIGVALGTALSVAFSPPLQLHDWQQKAATTLSHLA